MTDSSQILTTHETIVLNSRDFCESMIEPLLLGIVMGLVPITIFGLFVAAWNQYRRGGSMGG